MIRTSFAGSMLCVELRQQMPLRIVRRACDLCRIVVKQGRLAPGKIGVARVQRVGKALLGLCDVWRIAFAGNDRREFGAIGWQRVRLGRVTGQIGDRIGGVGVPELVEGIGDLWTTGPKVNTSRSRSRHHSKRRSTRHRYSGRRESQPGYPRSAPCCAFAG
jgi:hypothetical protein